MTGFFRKVFGRFLSSKSNPSCSKAATSQHCGPPPSNASSHIAASSASSTTSSLSSSRRRVRIRDVYSIKEEIGKGASSVVHRCVHRQTKEEFAVKILDKQRLSRDQMDMFRKEVRILELVHHPNVVRMVAHFESRHKFYVVMELLHGGQLFDRILLNGRFEEAEAMNTMRQIVSAVKCLHAAGIVHRDLKPENFMYVTKQSDSPLKLIDFGLASLPPPEECPLTAQQRFNDCLTTTTIAALTNPTSAPAPIFLATRPSYSLPSNFAARSPQNSECPPFSTLNMEPHPLTPARPPFSLPPKLPYSISTPARSNIILVPSVSQSPCHSAPVSPSPSPAAFPHTCAASSAPSSSSSSSSSTSSSSPSTSSSSPSSSSSSEHTFNTPPTPKRPRRCYRVCGTPAYLSPEMVRGLCYDYAADMWSVGVILYILLSGRTPFPHQDRNTLFSLIKHGKYSFPDKHWCTVSPNARDLVVRLLEVNPRQRLRAEEALAHVWMRVGM